MRRSVAILGCLVLLAGCGSQAKEYTDAPVGEVQPNTKANIITMPDTFGNVSYKCGQFGEMIYVTTNNARASSSLFVVPNSEGCKAR
jgi:PBP1b-binding outer membrane lipoprotein LpoB